MLKHLLLSISILFASTALAESNTEFSGFAYTTQFGDAKWQESKSIVAMNVDHMHDWFDFRAQVSTYESSPVRRLTIGSTFSVSTRSHATVQLGRMSRVNSFFDNVVDTPAASGMALLPMAGYSYRMFQGAFVLADGIKADYALAFNDHMITTHYTHGYMVIPDQKEFKLEVLKKNVDGITLEPMIGDTVELHHEYKSIHTYVSRSRYAATTTLQGTSTLAKYYYANANIAKYDLDKIGVKYDDSLFFVMLEYTTGYSATYSTVGVRTAKTDAWDQATVLGLYIDNGWFVYTGESIGTNLTAKTNAIDRFTGLTKRSGKVTLSAAYHEGRGQGWMRYEALTPYEWKSLVTSLTVQF